LPQYISTQPQIHHFSARSLDTVYGLLRLHVNFFRPVQKLVGKSRDGAKVRKVHDTARTPYQRLLASGVLTRDKERQLANIYAALNPVTLLREIRKAVEYVWTLADRQHIHNDYGKELDT
jgi:hypothetical protein